VGGKLFRVILLRDMVSLSFSLSSFSMLSLLSSNPSSANNNAGLYRESFRDCIVQVAKMAQIPMAKVPPRTPSLRKTWGKAKDPAPQIHFPMLVAAERVFWVPREEEESKGGIESGGMSQAVTVLLPAMHGSSSVACNCNSKDGCLESLPFRLEELRRCFRKWHLFDFWFMDNPDLKRPCGRRMGEWNPCTSSVVETTSVAAKIIVSHVR